MNLKSSQISDAMIDQSAMPSDNWSVMASLASLVQLRVGYYQSVGLHGPGPWVLALSVIHEAKAERAMSPLGACPGTTWLRHPGYTRPPRCTSVA